MQTLSHCPQCGENYSPKSKHVCTARKELQNELQAERKAMAQGTKFEVPEGLDVDLEPTGASLDLDTQGQLSLAISASPRSRVGKDKGLGGTNGGKGIPLTSATAEKVHQRATERDKDASEQQQAKRREREQQNPNYKEMEAKAAGALEAVAKTESAVGQGDFHGQDKYLKELGELKTALENSLKSGNATAMARAAEKAAKRCPEIDAAAVEARRAAEREQLQLEALLKQKEEEAKALREAREKIAGARDALRSSIEAVMQGNDFPGQDGYLKELNALRSNLDEAVSQNVARDMTRAADRATQRAREIDAEAAEARRAAEQEKLQEEALARQEEGQEEDVEKGQEEAGGALEEARAEARQAEKDLTLLQNLVPSSLKFLLDFALGELREKQEADDLNDLKNVLEMAKPQISEAEKQLQPRVKALLDVDRALQKVEEALKKADEAVNAEKEANAKGRTDLHEPLRRLESELKKARGETDFIATKQAAADAMRRCVPLDQEAERRTKLAVERRNALKQYTVPMQQQVKKTLHEGKQPKGPKPMVQAWKLVKKAHGAFLAALDNPETPGAAVKKAIDRIARALQQYPTQEQAEEQAEEQAKIEELLHEKIDGLKISPADKEAVKALPQGVALSALKVLDDLFKNEKSDEQGKTTAALLYAVRFGPLSRTEPDLPAVVPGLSEEEAAEREELALKRQRAMSSALEQVKDHPQLALAALDLIAKAQHPKAVAKGIAKVAKIQDGAFAQGAAHPAQGRKMARNALQMGGMLGGDYFERMEAYYQKYENSEPPADPNRVADGKAALEGEFLEKTALKTTAALGRAVLGEDGKVNFDSEAAAGVRDNLHFHPDSLKDPLPMLALQVEKFRKEFTGPDNAKFVAALEATTEPAGAAAQWLVRGALGVKGGEKPTKQDAQAAILGAMMTPLFQGDAGSCFATSSCMDYREQKPVELMHDLAEMASRGTLTKAGLDPVPVVVNTPNIENALFRSHEYTAATLGERTEWSKKKQLVRDKGMFAILKVEKSTGGDLLKMMGGSSGAGKGIEKFESLGKALSETLVYTYDPAMEQDFAAQDGNSNSGGWRMTRKDGSRVTSLKEVEQGLEEAFVKAVGDSADRGQIKTIVQKVASQLVEDYGGMDKLGAMSGGGSAAPTKAVLFGGKPESKPLVPKAGGTKAQNTQAILTGVVKGLKDRTDDTATIELGFHYMRAMPKHPSLDALKASPDVDKAVQEVFDDARKTAKEPMDADRTKGLYNKALASVLDGFLDGKLDGLEGDENGPAGGQTPQQLKEHILKLARPKVEQQCKEEGRTDEVEDDAAALSRRLDAFLVEELYPQFTIADTNYGDATRRIVHVIAPDPMTGEPAYWGKIEPSGRMVREDGEDDNWVDAEWQTMDVNRGHGS